MDASTRQGRVIIAEHCRMAREQYSGQSSAKQARQTCRAANDFEQKEHWKSRRARLAHRHVGPPESLFRGGRERHGCHSEAHTPESSLEPPQSKKASGLYF